MLVSPSNTAHLTGCGHNDESDPSDWGEIIGVSRAWERLGRGETIATNGGAVVGRPAKQRCRDCENR